jgi:hypothetical protein
VHSKRNRNLQKGRLQFVPERKSIGSQKEPYFQSMDLEPACRIRARIQNVLRRHVERQIPHRDPALSG